MARADREKKREYEREYYKKNKEKRREYLREWRLKNKEKVLDKTREYKKEYYVKNRKRVLERSREWYLNNWVRNILRGAKDRAHAKGLGFDLKPEDVVIPAVCPILGIPLEIGGENRDNSPSLDRIDNTKGYVKGNVMVISYRANTLKRDCTVEEARRIALYLEVCS